MSAADGNLCSYWKTAQTLYWRGKPYPRLSPDYQQLLRAAFRTCYDSNPDYRAALAATAGMNLDHSLGKNDPMQTVLAIAEFTDILTWLRDEKGRGLSMNSSPSASILAECKKKSFMPV